MSLLTFPEYFNAWQLMSSEFDKLGVLRCDECSNIIKSPIMSSESGLNACNRCVDTSNNAELKNAVLVRNFALEKILQRLYVPCSFVGEGCCETKVEYTKLVEHEEQCKFRSYSCPTKNVTECYWRGSIEYISKHIREQHPAFVEDSNDAVFEFHANNLPKNDIIKMIPFNKEEFILFGHFDVETKMFYYKVRQIISGLDFHSTCKCQSVAFNKTGLKTKEAFDIREYAYSDDLHDLPKLYLQDDTVFSVTITTNKTIDSSIHNKRLQELECPVCQEYMLSKIYQCSNGHSVCITCAKNLAICPICRTFVRQNGTRNHLVEALINYMHFPCKYQELGCKANLSKLDLTKHQDVCHYKNFNCLFPNCKASLNMFSSWEFAKHLMTDHSQLVVLGNFIGGNLHSLVENRLFYMIAYGCIFEITYPKNRKWIQKIHYTSNKLDDSIFEVKALYCENKSEKEFFLFLLKED